MSFEKKIRKSPVIKIQEPIKEINSSPQSQSQFTNSSPVIPVISQFDFDFTQYMTPNISIPEILSIEEEILNTIDSIDFKNQSSYYPYEINFPYLETTPVDMIGSPTVTKDQSFDLLIPINENNHDNNDFD